MMIPKETLDMIELEHADRIKAKSIVSESLAQKAASGELAIAVMKLCRHELGKESPDIDHLRGLIREALGCIDRLHAEQPKEPPQ